jgi:predicted RNA-binding Zn-ribbon protein involved in translation (DUF1610 family)
MDNNEKIKCPSCDKEINKLANLCIHCRVNLIQHRKDHPLVDDDENIDISTQITPNLRNEDVIQRIEDKPSIFGFIFTVLLAIFFAVYSIKEISEFIMFVLIARNGDIDTAYNIVYLEMTDSSLRQKIILESTVRTLKGVPIIISVTTVSLFILLYLGDSISYFKKLKLFNLKVNSNEFNTCTSCNHDQVHFHATSCPKCGSPNVNMFIKETQRNLGGNIALLAGIIISIAGAKFLFLSMGYLSALWGCFAIYLSIKHKCTINEAGILIWNTTFTNLVIHVLLIVISGVLATLVSF